MCVVCCVACVFFVATRVEDVLVVMDSFSLLMLLVVVCLLVSCVSLD